MEFRPLEKEDLRYIWAAYRKGCLASMGERFSSGEMDAETFAIEFEAEVQTVYHAAWALLAETKKGLIPVGIVLGFYSHPNPRFAPFMIVGDMAWFPWASPRNRLESAVNFFNRVRKDIAMVEYAHPDDKRFFEVIARHGLMRRVGTMHNVYPGEATAVFETRQL